MPAPSFSQAEVLEIRYQHSRGMLDAKAWADAKLCSVETIRRVARGDTYRHQAGVKAHPSYGGLQSPAAGLRPAVGSQVRVSPPSDLATNFVPPAELPSLAGLAQPADEPDAAEAEASLARLQAALAMPVPGDEQASAAEALLDQLKANAGLAPAKPPSDGPAKPDGELG